MPEQQPEQGRRAAVYLRAVPPLPEEGRAAYARRLRDEAHTLLREALARAGVSVTEYMRGPHGKPYLPDGKLFFNLTHCRGLAACMVCGAECGIDAEPFSRPVNSGVARRICAPEELVLTGEPFDFFRLWTLKESFVKALGTGLSYPLREAAFSPGPEGLRFCRDGFLFRHFVTDEHLVALCVRQPGGKARPIHPQPLALPAQEDLTFDLIF